MIDPTIERPTGRTPSSARPLRDLVVASPYDGRVVGALATTPIENISDVVRRAKTAQQDFAPSLPFERRRLLGRLADAIAAHAGELAALISAEMGKTIAEARHEVRRAQNTLRLSGDAATFLDGEVLHCGIVEGGVDRQAVVTWEPVGVVGAITPFNYPVNLLCHKLGPAIAAGNAIVVKPSPKAPLAADLLQALALEAGFPEGLVQTIHGHADAAIALASAPIDLLSFTGGPAAGLALKRASGLVRTLMELGGNDPLIVLPDANLDAAVATAVAQRFEIAGQSCAAVKKLYLHAAIADAFIERLLGCVDTIQVGDPADEATQMGPVIDEVAAQTVEARIAEARGNGARILAGGTRRGTLLAPTVIDAVPPDSTLVTTETFGPVLSIRRFTDVERAITEINSGAYGLQAGVFTNDHAAIRQFSRELRVGGVMINEGPDFRAEHVPFGGIKQSGLGREGVRIAMREMSEPKVVVD